MGSGTAYKEVSIHEFTVDSAVARFAISNDSRRHFGLPGPFGLFDRWSRHFDDRDLFGGICYDLDEALKKAILPNRSDGFYSWCVFLHLSGGREHDRHKPNGTQPQCSTGRRTAL